MNLLIVTPYFAPQTGGVATYVEDLRRSLSSKGHEVCVLREGQSHSIQQCPLNRDDRVFELYMRPFWSPQAPLKGAVTSAIFLLPTLWRLTRFLRNHRVDIVCLEYPLAYMFYFLLVRAWLRIRVVVGLHGSEIHLLHCGPRHERWLVRQIIRRADWVLAHSRQLLADAERIVGDLPRNRSLLPCWVDSELLHNQGFHRDWVRLETSSKYVLTVAKLFPRKGLDVLLRAIRKLRHLPPGYQFIIAGDGPEEAELKQLASRLGLETVVTLTGSVKRENIPALLRECEFFVLPSRSEPFGIVVLEAMAFGKAVIATRVGGIPEFVTDSSNGLLVPPEDSDALADRIQLLLDDETLRHRLGRNALETVESRYDRRIVSGRYEELFASIIASA